MAESKTGTCAYCGQSTIIETVGDVTQTERDQMATDQCNCPQAQSERRKKIRKEKIEAYIDKHFEDQDVRILVREIIDLVEHSQIGTTTFALGEEKTVKIWVDSDAWLHVKVKKTEDEEFKA